MLQRLLYLLNAVCQVITSCHFLLFVKEGRLKSGIWYFTSMYCGSYLLERVVKVELCSQFFWVNQSPHVCNSGLGT